MNELEMTTLCRDAMGFSPLVAIPTVSDGSACLAYTPPQYAYDPLSDDAQAMALVKRFLLTVEAFSGAVYPQPARTPTCYSDESLNRAIVECVAKMQLDRTAPETPSPNDQ